MSSCDVPNSVFATILSSLMILV